MNIASDSKIKDMTRNCFPSSPLPSPVNQSNLLSISYSHHENRKYCTFSFVIRNSEPSDYCLSQSRPLEVNGQSKKQPSAFKSIHTSFLAARTVLTTLKAQAITSLILQCPPQQTFLELQVGTKNYMPQSLSHWQN